MNKIKKMKLHTSRFCQITHFTYTKCQVNCLEGKRSKIITGSPTFITSANICNISLGYWLIRVFLQRFLIKSRISFNSIYRNHFHSTLLTIFQLVVNFIYPVASGQNLFIFLFRNISCYYHSFFCSQSAVIEI